MSLGLITDPFLFVAYHFASATWDSETRDLGFVILCIWWLFTKVVKRIGLFRRNPWDLVYLPVSIIFGFLHGFIKIIALFTWNVVSLAHRTWNMRFLDLWRVQTSWGSRPDGDINDSERMMPRALPAEVMINPSAHTQGLVRYRDEKVRISEKDQEEEEKERFYSSGSENTI